MPRSLAIIRQHPGDGTGKLDHDSGASVTKELFDITLGKQPTGLVPYRPDIEDYENDQNDPSQQLLASPNHETAIVPVAAPARGRL